MSGTISANPAVDLTTAADVQAWMTALNVVAIPAAQVQQMVTAMSAEIQAWLGYNIIQQTYTTTFDGRGASKVAFPNSPVTAVSSLTINGENIPSSAGALSPGYMYTTLQGQSWLGLRGYRFWGGMQNCTITYTAGFKSNNIPAALVQACREAITALSQIASREPGLTKEKVGGLEEDYAAPQPSNNPMTTFVLTPSITLALMPLRRVVPAW